MELMDQLIDGHDFVSGVKASRILMDVSLERGLSVPRMEIAGASLGLPLRSSSRRFATY